MLNYSSIRELYKSADSIQSNHLVIAEWNMNKYSTIDKCGLYKNNDPAMSYPPAAADITSGKNIIVYDDNSTKIDPQSYKFSQLESVFEPNRPDPGIVFIQNFPNTIFSGTNKNISVGSLSTASARFYLVSENETYDYYNSAKNLYLKDNKKQTGVTNSKGKISNVNPFVAYENEIMCNKIVIKVQNHMAVPHKFSIDILVLQSSNPDVWVWEKVYDESSSASADFISGEFNLYFNGGTWSKNISRLNNFDELISDNPTQFKKIKGIRLNVNELACTQPSVLNNQATENISFSLELIEISPRLEADVTSYVSSFNIESSLNDTTLFGLPVGSIVSGAGSVELSNEDGQFLFSSILSTNKMLNEDVKFSFYQKVYVPPEYSPGDETFNIPLGVLFSSRWNIGDDYSVTVNLEDGTKFLRQLSAPDIIVPSYCPLSTIILMLLDNVGVTGYEFKKSSDSMVHDKEDIIIKNFFCKKEQTVLEVLEQLAIGTQCSMYYDVSGKLNVLTKEKLTQNVRKDSSSSVEVSINPDPKTYVWYNNIWFKYSGKQEDLPPGTTWTYDNDLQFWISDDHPLPPQSPGTDFWFIMDDKYDESDAEYSFINNYVSNVSTISEEKINPITDGDITYHYYGPKKIPLSANLANNQNKLFNQLAIDQFPMNSLALSNFDYGTTILWKPADDTSAVLGAANIIKDITDKRLTTLYGDKNYAASSENDAIRKMFNDNDKKTDEHRQSLIIYLDINEGLTISGFEGFILIDREYIKYRGKLYYVAGTGGVFGYRIIFSEEEFNQLTVSLDKGDSIIFRGLVVDVVFNKPEKNDNKYDFKIIGDGRGKFNSDVEKHFASVEQSDGIEPEKRFKLTLGESSNYKTPGALSATSRFNFFEKGRYKSLMKVLGTLPPQTLSTYLGFLKISGPTGPKEDANALLSILSASSSKSTLDRLEKINKQVDLTIPKIPNAENPEKFDEDKSFHDYVYLNGERSIYGQKITLPFAPNFLTTRMRLFSPRKRIFENQEIMSTNSSIAGIGFGLNENGEGYYLEVESAGSGKQFVEENAFLNNLRFYKVYLSKDKKGKVVYTPELLLKESVGAFTVYDTAVEVIKYDDKSMDPVFELDIEIKQYKNAMVYTIYYGDIKIGSYTEKIGEAININSRTIFMFVRNDSQAIYEYISAAAKPFRGDPGSYFRGREIFEKRMEQGIIPVNKSFLFRDDDNILFYFNDFGKLARQVKEYDVRFTAPALTSVLIDVSRINPDYLIKKYVPTAFGAKIVVVNTSSGPITLDDEATRPLYVVGVALEELNSGIITAKTIYGDDDENDEQLNKLRKSDREKNIAIYGEQTFSLDNQFIQTNDQALSLMRWILQHCNRQRLKLSMEIFENPLLELGDKVKIYDKTRGYYINNQPFFGEKTFTVSSISRSVNDSGPVMNITLIEVGEA